MGHQHFVDSTTVASRLFFVPLMIRNVFAPLPEYQIILYSIGFYTISVRYRERITLYRYNIPIPWYIGETRE